MKTKQKQSIKYILFTIFLITLCSISIVYAKEITSAEIKFCDYKNTRITLRTLGYIITIIKVAVPLLLIGTAMMDFFKVVISGKTEDTSKALSMILKRSIAGIIVFLVPTLMNLIFNNLIEYNDPSTKNCTTCLLDTSKCDTNITDPSYTIEVAD